MSRNLRSNGRKRKPAWKGRMARPQLWFAVTGEIHGSGPGPGILELSSRAVSLGATRQYRMPGSAWAVGVEYVYHWSQNALVYGLLPLGPSAHVRLASAIRLNPETTEIVAGHMRIDHLERTVTTNEHTGHFPGNWNDQARDRLASAIMLLLPEYRYQHERYQS